PEEVADPEVVGEPLEWIARAECDRQMLRVGLVAQAEVMVHELSPGPAPLRDAVLGEQVLADVVEDAVADPPRRRAGGHRGHAVGVVRRRDAQVVRAGAAPGGIRLVIAVAIQGPVLSRGLRRRRWVRVRRRSRLRRLALAATRGLLATPRG